MVDKNTNMVANKYILGIAFCIIYTVLACKDKPQKPTRIKRLPTVDSTDTFLFYKLPPADFTPKMDSTHIGYWSIDEIYRDEIWVYNFYTLNRQIFYDNIKVHLYSDSFRIANKKLKVEGFNKSQSNNIQYRFTLTQNDTIIEHLSNDTNSRFISTFYRIPRLTFPRERALHYFNQCRRHDSTTLFRWTFKDLPIISRFYKKDDSMFLEAYTSEKRINNECINPIKQKDGSIILEHCSQSWKSVAEYFHYFPDKQMMLLVTGVKKKQIDTVRFISNTEYKYNVYGRDSLFFYGNPDIEEW